MKGYKNSANKSTQRLMIQDKNKGSEQIGSGM